MSGMIWYPHDVGHLSKLSWFHSLRCKPNHATIIGDSTDHFMVKLEMVTLWETFTYLWKTRQPVDSLRVTNLKRGFLKLKDKMLVFARLLNKIADMDIHFDWQAGDVNFVFKG